jgi:hypothetical protein
MPLIEQISGLLTFVFADNVRSDYLGHLVFRVLVDQVPKLHVWLLRVLRILEGDRSLQGHLSEQMRLCFCKVSKFLNIRFVYRLITLEANLNCG